MTSESAPESPVLALARELIARPSVTPEDAGCQAMLAERLARIGFAAEWLDAGGVTNLWARRGRAEPLFVFAGHTDVVPAGPREQWDSDPFDPVVRDGQLYGRGAADMKGGIAAMVVAVERFVAEHPGHAGSIAFLLTSDEEGIATHGTRHVVSVLEARKEKIRWCLVGEPTSEARLGDGLKLGRRGSLTGELRVFGVQGHVAYPEKSDNPVHRAVPALAALAATRWDEGNAHFPATTFQISNIHAGTGADNVVPGTLDVLFNFRFSTEVTEAELRARVEALLREHGLRFEIRWRLSGHPFLTEGGELLEAARAAIRTVAGIETRPNTAGGTSDGRFIAPTGAQVIELGLRNATIHKVNECAAVADLELLADTYADILRRLLAAR